MQCRWHNFLLNCPECKVEVAVEALLFSADQEIRLDGRCPSCHKGITYQVFAAKLAYIALTRDMEQNKPNKPPPQKLLPPVKTDLAEGDEGWLKTIGIGGKKC